MSYGEMIGFMLFLAAFGGMVWRIGSGIQGAINSSSTQQTQAVNKTNEKLGQIAGSVDKLTEHVTKLDDRLTKVEQGRSVIKSSKAIASS